MKFVCCQRANDIFIQDDGIRFENAVVTNIMA